ncbi:MAG: hypothetical protein JNL80_00470 [Phycisphaerae bacterium]|jgi:UDP-N-acetylglucosamine diphosphorylase/glucosamine-1-phosphate N-acetyltransferase|nr:hypothetical protein [Phycisphaerae bacterium]
MSAGTAERRPMIVVDDGLGSFGPLCDLRPSYALRTGAVTTVERLQEEARGEVVGFRVPPRLAALVAEASRLPTNRLPDGDGFLFVNGRLLSLAALTAVPGDGDEGAVVRADGTLIAAWLRRTTAILLMDTGRLPDGVPVAVSEAPLLATPWELLDRLGPLITADVERIGGNADSLGYRVLPARDPARMGEHLVLIHRSATIAPYVVFDTTAGPIHVGPKAVIRPFAVLCGPCSIGAGTTVSDRSLIKPNTACGPQCRLGGEIGGTSIIGYSNKTHDGHLGDSILGEWVNLGAGTDNSNLLNTYGEVPIRLEPEGPRQRSGRIFLGSVIGDHVKCAIGTRLMTGTVIGTGAMIAGSTPPPSTVRRFAWITDGGERRFALGKFIEVMRAVMKRRSLEPGPAYLAEIEAVHRTSGDDDGAAS